VCLVPASVLMDRGQLDAAKVEIDKAQILADRGNYTGYKRGVRNARSRLASLRNK